MKTPTRILVGGPEVTSAFVLMGLALARKRMMAGRASSTFVVPRESGRIQYTVASRPLRSRSGILGRRRPRVMTAVNGLQPIAVS